MFVGLVFLLIIDIVNPGNSQNVACHSISIENLLLNE